MVHWTNFFAIFGLVLIKKNLIVSFLKLINKYGTDNAGIRPTQFSIDEL